MRIRFLTLVVVTCLLFSPVYSQRPRAFDGCPPQGLGKKTPRNPTGQLSQFFIDLNLLKNRDSAPGRIDRSITLAEILKSANDDKFDNSQGAEITGYVAYVYPGEAGESCNCSRTDLRDIHIAIVCSPRHRDDKTRWMFVEVTPRFQRSLGTSESLQVLEGTWVKFKGWMFYDAQHKGNAKTVNPRGKAIWRATPWEIHPVTEISRTNVPNGNSVCR
jgi:hypothetical protein